MSSSTFMSNIWNYRVLKLPLLIEFWCSMLQEYPELAKRALEALIPFPTTYLCEGAMSALVNIKTAYRNLHRVANDMRIALSNIKPRIEELVSKSQEQRSHCLIICAVFCRVNCDILLIPCFMLSQRIFLIN